MFDAIFSGPPANVPAPGGSTVTVGIDTNSGAEYINVGAGWAPVSSSVVKTVALAQASTLASLATYSAPATGLYRVTVYTAQATATAGTLPVPSVAYTEGDTSATFTTALAGSGTATTVLGQSQASSLVINVKAGTNIVISTAAPTTLTYNAKARVEFIG